MLPFSDCNFHKGLEFWSHDDLRAGGIDLGNGVIFNERSLLPSEHCTTAVLDFNLGNMTVTTFNLAALKQVKNSVIGNPTAKLSLAQDDAFIRR